MLLTCSTAARSSQPKRIPATAMSSGTHSVSTREGSGTIGKFLRRRFAQLGRQILEAGLSLRLDLFPLQCFPGRHARKRQTNGQRQRDEKGDGPQPGRASGNGAQRAPRPEPDACQQRKQIRAARRSGGGRNGPSDQTCGVVTSTGGSTGSLASSGTVISAGSTEERSSDAVSDRTCRQKRRRRSSRQPEAAFGSTVSLCPPKCR